MNCGFILEFGIYTSFVCFQVLVDPDWGIKAMDQLKEEERESKELLKWAWETAVEETPLLCAERKWIKILRLHESRSTRKELSNAYSYASIGRTRKRESAFQDRVKNAEIASGDWAASPPARRKSKSAIVLNWFGVLFLGSNFIRLCKHYKYSLGNR